MKTFIKSYLPSFVFFLSGIWLWYSTVYDVQDGKRRAGEIQRNIFAHQKQNEVMALEIEELRTLVVEIKNNPQRMEELARRHLQMIKPGEVFILPSGE
ncbi:MAG: FtsB family cell division protein [Gammaproteobacteria bacterium WSBS_2016_MAG_OTU1]